MLDMYDLVGLIFYSISTLVGYFVPNPLYTYILDMYDLFGFYGILTINNSINNQSFIYTLKCKNS